LQVQSHEEKRLNFGGEENGFPWEGTSKKRETAKGKGKGFKEGENPFGKITSMHWEPALLEEKPARKRRSWKETKSTQNERDVWEEITMGTMWRASSSEGGSVTGGQQKMSDRALDRDVQRERSRKHSGGKKKKKPKENKANWPWVLTKRSLRKKSGRLKGKQRKSVAERSGTP